MTAATAHELLTQLLDAVDKKLKMGKSCLNFNRADELPLDVIGEIVAAFTPEEFQERLAVKDNISFRRLIDAGDQVEHGGLARAVWAD